MQCLLTNPAVSWSVDARDALRLICIPGALPPGVSVAITCFESAFQPAAAADDGQDASSVWADLRGDAGGAPAPLDLQPTQRSSLLAPARCVLEAATVQHCLVVVALSLAVLGRGLRLQPAAAPAAEEAELLGCVIAEFMQHGDEEAQVQPGS